MSATSRLSRVRIEAGVTQDQAAAHFGLTGRSRRETFGKWERGQEPSSEKHRAAWISYLWDRLQLRSRPAVFESIWRDVMVGEWRFLPLEPDEHPGGQSTDRRDGIAARVRPFEILPPSHPFVGRERETASIVSYLDQAASAQRVALCALRGMGGVGKTELAREIAQKVRDRFPDGQLQIDLLGEEHAHQLSEQLLTPMQILRSIIERIEPGVQAPAGIVELSAYYRSVLHGRRLLILADNARDTKQVELLKPPVGCALIVTSRHHIHVVGMKTFVLDVLDPASHPGAAEAILLEICPEIGPRAAELARLCAYLPLALRVCASLLAETSRDPETLIAELHSERLLHMQAPESPQEPAYSVVASLALSYNSLGPELQQAMQQLSVFPTRFDRAAAAAVLEVTTPIEQTLEKLYMRSMVDYHRDSGRYALHDLVREFCLKRLTDLDGVRLRHAQHYLAIARTAEKLYISGQPLEGLALFDLEQTHIDAGWEWARQHAGSAAADDLLIHFDGTLFYIGDLRYDSRTERIWQAEAMRDAATRQGRRYELMLSYNNLAVPFFRTGDYREAISAFEAGLALARELGDAMQEGNFLNNLGFALIKTGELDKAIEYSKARIAVAAHLSERRAVLRAEAAGMANLADAYLRRGDAELSLACAQRGHELTVEYGDRRGQCTALGNMASAYRDLGQRELAIQFFGEAIALAEELKDMEELSESSWKLGQMLADREPTRALALMSVRIEHLEALKHPDLLQHQAEFKELCDRMT